MKCQRSNIFKKMIFCLIILFLGLISVSVTHAETYTFVTKWGSYGTGDGQFNSPCDVTVDPFGNVYVVDTYNSRIQKFDDDGTYIIKWGSAGSSNGQFAYPMGVDVDSSGNVYIADTYNHRIQKFDSSGTFITKWGSYGTGDGQFSYPESIEVDSSGNVYVADTSNGRIQKFDSSGNYITQWGNVGSPWGIDFDSSGNVYVADSSNHRILKFDSNGNYITQWGSYGEGVGQFHTPAGIAVDSSGNVYVADYHNDRIQEFDSKGNYITQIGSWGTGDGQFRLPAGLAFDSSGNFYVADRVHYRIQKFAKEKTTPIIMWNTPVDIVYGTPLSSTQLNAVGSVSGTFVYTPLLGTLLSAGMQTLHVDFTPTDTTKYTSVSKDVTINVLKATPVITWSNPADITYGTPLDSTQLNAVASPGTFVYTPPAGTVLDVGTHTLHVDFIPSDPATYNTASADVQINVLISPPTINSIAVPLNPVPVSTSITANASVTYLGDLNSLTAEWNWGDGSISQSQGSSNFEASHVYNSAGIYTITFTVKDNNGGFETQQAPNYVVVYDPEGGFVTGGGWINSPTGAYIADETLVGKATFGFVSKYQKGATVPTGKTEFQFKVADLNFHSESYDWLVVAGSQAKYKGTGTINGEGNYGFMLSAVDGAIKGDNTDKFRIKIWDKESNGIIYDNEIGTEEDSEPSTAISGGSIIIHKEK